jgi:tetratricopeptide (TPR) repeat protein
MSHGPQTGAPRWAVVAICAALVVGTLAVFLRTVAHEFVEYDDSQYVYENPMVTHGLSGPGIVEAFTAGHAGNWHPLTWLSHMLDWQLFGPWAGGHHLTSVLLHAAVAVLLFLVLLQSGRHTPCAVGDLRHAACAYYNAAAFWPSAVVAALFAIHPLRVESVAWVAERKDLLSGLFFLLTLAAYIHYARRPFSWGRYLAVLLLFALGLMSKPMLVTLPAVLLLLDYWPLARLGWTTRVWVEKIPLALLSMASCIVTFLVQREAEAVNTHFLLSTRVANALVAYVTYIGQIFYPVDLAVFYPYTPGGLPAWKVLGAIAVLSGISAAALLLRRKAPYLLVGWLWYLGMLVPVIGLLQVGSQSMADRYTYLPQIGLYLAMVWGAADLCRLRPWGRWVGGIGAAGAIVMLMALAVRQTSYWRDGQSLWTHALNVTPPNHIAYYNMGMVLQRQRQLDAAIDYYQQSLALLPTYALAHNNLGLALYEQRRMDEALEHFRQALASNPRSAEAHNNLANLLSIKGQRAEAIEEYAQAISLNPQYVDGHCNLGDELRSQGRPAEALEHYQQALTLAIQQNRAGLIEALQKRIASCQPER